MIAEPPRCRDTAKLEPALAGFAVELLERYAHQYPGRELRVLETLRSPDRQTWLWQHGRGPDPDLRRKAKVTWTRRSRHMANVRGWSDAVDIGVFVEGRLVAGTTPAELQLYRDMVTLGLEIAATRHLAVRNLGAVAGKDWLHWELVL